MALTITFTQRRELERRIRTRKARAEDVRRARVILMLADGESYTTITPALACHPAYISLWKRRFIAEGLDGLRAKYRGQPFHTHVCVVAEPGGTVVREDRTRLAGYPMCPLPGLAL